MDKRKQIACRRPKHKLFVLIAQSKKLCFACDIISQFKASCKCNERNLLMKKNNNDALAFGFNVLELREDISLVMLDLKIKSFLLCLVEDYGDMSFAFSEKISGEARNILRFQIQEHISNLALHLEKVDLALQAVSGLCGVAAGQEGVAPIGGLPLAAAVS
jgi:hypothetical protein